jgi:uncharacterized protein YrrD
MQALRPQQHAPAFLRDLEGYAIRATDGEIGKLTDSLFDDVDWIVRYFVVSTGSWLFGREVLLTPDVCERADWRKRELVTSVTRERVEQSPPLVTKKPVSRQYEIELQGFHGWPAWWSVPLPAATQRGDPHLRSLREVSGYKVHAKDREIGTVEDLLVDERSWTVEHLVVDTGTWLASRKILIPRSRVGEVEWTERTVTVAGSSREIEESGPTYDPAAAIKHPPGK